MPNTAHIYRAASGNFNVSFNHPICREGSIGKKIHRGLRVSDEGEAMRRRDEVNELLALAERGPSSIPPRHIAEKRYSDVVVSAFYDCMNPEPVNYMALRDKEIQIPDAVPVIQLVGSTGVGKTRLTQHLLQTTKQNFPMRGAGRMTVADAEIVVDDADYEAVVTFYSEAEIREVIRENLIEACEFSHAKPSDTIKIAAKLLVDADKRFRFNFVLGNLQEHDPSESDDEDEDSDAHTRESHDESEVTPEVKRQDQARLEDYVARIVSMASEAYQRAVEDLRPNSSEDQAVVREYWVTYVDEVEINALIEDILKVLRERLSSTTGSDIWPVSFRLPKTKDKDEFFKALRPFYQNDRRFFGSLVTPLVQGIRVRGRFYPVGLTENPNVSWVLLDGQGLGHEQENAAKLGATVPPSISQKFEMADVICLVDRAVPPMVSGSPAPMLLSELVARGHTDKLILAFTHFEGVNAPDLDQPGRKQKVLESVAGVIQSLDSLPKFQRIKLEEELESRTVFLARLDRDSIGAKATLNEFQKLCDRLANPVVAPYSERRPLYNEYRIAEAVSREIRQFRADWGTEALASYHWKIMEALTNWVGHAYSDGYPRRNLYPGQDLARRLITVISQELESPEGWDPIPPTPVEESAILNAIRAEVSKRVDALCGRHVIQEARTPDWLPAYRDISGFGTKRRRATRVARILEDRARLPEEGLGEFIKEIWADAISAGIDAALADRTSS